MKRIWISMAASAFMATSVMLTSCGGNNGDMPPETFEDTQETGIEDPESPMGTTTGDTIGTTAGTTTGTTTGTTAGTTAGGTTDGTTAGGTTTGGTTGTTTQ